MSPEGSQLPLASVTLRPSTSAVSDRTDPALGTLLLTLLLCNLEQGAQLTQNLLNKSALTFLFLPHSALGDLKSVA